MNMKELGLLCVFVSACLSGCAITDKPSYSGMQGAAIPHQSMVNYGGDSPYYWASEPDSYYPTSGYYSPGYQYHYTTVTRFGGQ